MELFATCRYGMYDDAVTDEKVSPPNLSRQTSPNKEDASLARPDLLPSKVDHPPEVVANGTTDANGQPLSPSTRFELQNNSNCPRTECLEDRYVFFYVLAALQ